MSTNRIGKVWKPVRKSIHFGLQFPPRAIHGLSQTEYLCFTINTHASVLLSEKEGSNKEPSVPASIVARRFIAAPKSWITRGRLREILRLRQPPLRMTNQGRAITRSWKDCGVVATTSSFQANRRLEACATLFIDSLVLRGNKIEPRLL